MYTVLVDFYDLQDGNHKYGVGDEYPRPGVVVSKNRIEELLTDKNRLHRPLIREPIKVAEKPIEEPLPFTEEAEKPKRGRKKKNAD